MITIEKSILGIKEGERILDAGCGEGRHTLDASKFNCSVYGLDIDRQCLKKTKYVLILMNNRGEVKGRWHLIQGDITKLPFKESSFDKVICSEVLEHIPDDKAAIRELVRVLKEGGRIGISVPTYITETIYWKLSPDYYHHPGGHIRKYKKREIVKRLSENGLYIYALHYKHAYHSIYWLLRCLFGLKKEKALIPALYYKFLVWEMKHNLRLFRLIEKFLNLLFPKSLVIYAYKGEHSQMMTSAREGKGRTILSRKERIAQERGWGNFERNSPHK